jgi:hypothetical protein
VRDFLDALVALGMLERQDMRRQERVKYWRTRIELIPEMYVVDMEPTSYPRAPIGKKRIWFDARTM